MNQCVAGSVVLQVGLDSIISFTFMGICGSNRACNPSIDPADHDRFDYILDNL